MRMLATLALCHAALAAPCRAQAGDGACSLLVPRDELRHASGLYERVGEVVDRDGDLLVVAAPTLTTKQAAVLIYAGGAGWSLEQELPGPDSEDFARNLAVSGTTVLVGAPGASFQVPHDQVEACAFDLASGVLYGVDLASDQLVVIDTATGMASARGAVGFDRVAGLTHDAASGRLLGSDLQTGLLVSIDPQDGTAVALGPLGYTEVNALAQDPESGVVYGVDTATDQLLSIDPLSGRATALGALGFDDVRGLSFCEAAGGLVGWDLATSALVRIDALTGAGTAIVSVPKKDARSLACAPGGPLFTVNLLQGNLLAVDPSSGATGLVGALSPNLFNAGKLYVYERLGSNPASWGVVAELFAEQPQPGALFGHFLALDGDTGAVAARQGSGSALPSVQVFQRDQGGPGAWGRSASLAAPQGASVGPVALAGALLAVRSDDVVVLYRREGPAGPWVEEARLTSPLASASGTIAIDGDRIAVAADDEGQLASSGSVEVFRREPDGTWQHEAHLPAPLAQVNGWFGTGLAMQDPYLFASLPDYAGDGYVAVFERTGQTWAQRHLQPVPHPWQLSDDFGTSLQVEGGTLLAGAPGHRHMAQPGHGAVLSFTLNDLPSAAFEAYCTAGTSGSGCAAGLCAWGQPSSSATAGFQVEASGVQGAKDGLYYFGISGRQALPWGASNSFQCVVPPVQRGPLLSGNGSGSFCDGWYTQDLNAYWCSGCPGAKKNPGAGAVCQVQLWYRDPTNTSKVGTSLSNALEFTVAP